MNNRNKSTLTAVLVLAILSVAADARAQKPESLRKFNDAPAEHRSAEKRARRVGERMATQMVDEMQRFRGLSHDSARKLLFRQTRHHLIVQSQCDFELRASRQHASTAWQALSDSVAQDTRRVVIRNDRLTAAEINEVLNRAARMARYCQDDRPAW